MISPEQELKRMIREVRTIAGRVGVGEFDDVDRALLRQLADLADWLKDATEITLKATE